MVKVNSYLKRNLAFIFWWSGIGILCLSGCAPDGTTDTNAISESGEVSDTEPFDRHDLTLEYNAYEKYYETKVLTDEKQIPLELWISNVGYKVAKIDGQEIPFNRERNVYLNDANITTTAMDFTGDGKDEIAIVSAGWSEYIVVFGSLDGAWQEIEIPYEVYDCDLSALMEFDPVLEETLEGLDVEMDVRKDPIAFSFEEEKIIAKNGIYTATDSTFVDLGTIRKELIYSDEEKKFVIAETVFCLTPP